MRRLSWVWLVALVAAALATAAPMPSKSVHAQVTVGATLSVLAPAVEVSSAGGPFVAARDGQTVVAGDQVRTGPTGVALLTFFDLSETQLTSDTLVQIEAAAPGNLISVFQSVGTSVSRVRAPSSTGGFQTDMPPATALVRGTTYVATARPPLPGAVCQRTDVTTCVATAILLADPDGRVGQVGLIGRVSGTIELTNACEVAAAAAQSTLGPLDPQICAELQQTVLNLRDPTAAGRTRQLAEQVNNDAAQSVGGGSSGGGGGGGSGSGGGGGSEPPGGDPSASGPSESPGSGAEGVSEESLALRSGAPTAARVINTSTTQTRFGIDEGYRNPAALADSGATWQRVVIGWRAVQPNGPDDFSNLGRTLPAEEIKAEVARGVRISALLQFTPLWAATQPDMGERSPPKNLDFPIEDPRNYWARFVYETVKFYNGQIEEFIIWNEPEFRPGDPGAGGSFTWLGSDEEFARLMKVAYLSAKRANPNAVVSFPGTSYWVEQNLGRTQFYERQLAIFARDPDAARNHNYHDVLALNVYRNPDDIMRLFTVFKGIQKRFGLDVPIWLTETNAMPADDRVLAPCDHAADSIPTTLEQQAGFGIQAFVLAAVAGYQRAGFYQMIDDNACMQPAVWGAVRDNGSRRPVFDALRTAIRGVGPFTQVRFAPLVREEQRWPVWPEDPASYWPNWQVYVAAFDLPDGRRVTVVWNGDGQAHCLHLARSGSGAAQLLDKHGTAQPAADQSGAVQVRLAPATARFADDPQGYYFIGGDPQLLVEENVPATAPIAPASLGCQ